MTTKTGLQSSHSMEKRLSEIGRRIDHLLSKVKDAAELRQVVKGEFDVWRQWRDELHLQAELASMEVRDALEPTIEKVDLAFDRALDRVDELIATAELDENDLRDSVEKEMKGLRQELDAATAGYRIA